MSDSLRGLITFPVSLVYGYHPPVRALRFRPSTALLVISAAALADGIVAQSGDADVISLIEPIRLKHHLPALGGAVVTSRGIVASGVTGVRKANTDVDATIDDQWHLGSDTKAMTAVIIATLVERGKLNWETTLAEVFPDRTASFPMEFGRITIKQLLSHHAGLPANLGWLAMWEVEKSSPSFPEQRLKTLQKASLTKLTSQPGTKFLYSNLGYTLAGAVAERVGGQSWEDLMREIVFNPLRMTSCGFGGLGTPGKIDQPWPHRENGKPMGKNGPAVDDPKVIGPAGTVHCSIGDWAKFIADQLRGERGEGALLNAKTYKTLHTAPYGDGYAFGWGVSSQEWAGGTVLQHTGSNTMNLCSVQLMLQRDFAILIVTNQGGNEANKAVSEANAALIRLQAR
jgi:CubicO group peptidase (beta-lactamase class C family)